MRIEQMNCFPKFMDKWKCCQGTKRIYFSWSLILTWLQKILNKKLLQLKRSWRSCCLNSQTKWSFSQIRLLNKNSFQIPFTISQEATIKWILKLTTKLSLNISIFKNHNCNNFSSKHKKNKFLKKWMMQLMTISVMLKLFLMIIKGKLFFKT